MTGVVGAMVVALLIVAAPTLFQHLPNAALAAVVIAAAIGLFEFGDLARIYRIQRWEFWLSILCTVGVAVFGAIPGIGLAIVIAVIEFLWDGWRPHWAVMGSLMASRATTTLHAIPKRAGYPASSCFAGMRRCFSPTPNCSATHPRCDRGISYSGAKDRGGRRTGYQRRCHFF